jgi:hypothetical protein
MASPAKLYQKEMHDNLGFFPTWFPGDPIAVGDIGVFQGGRFRRTCSLDELGIPGTVEAAPSKQSVQFASTSGTKVSTSGDAKVPGVGALEIKVEFSKKGAFVFHALSLRLERLDRRAEVGERIVEAYQQRKWQKEWLLVESVHGADSLTTIVSEDASAEVVLKASAEGNLAAMSLADPKINLAVSSTRGQVLHIVCGRGLHPLYSCIRLTDPLFGTPSIQPVRGVEDSEMPFCRPGIDELLES